MDDLGPQPLLDVLESSRIRFVDLDRSIVVDTLEFHSVESRLAASARRAGLRPGDVVVSAVGNGPLFLASIAAVIRVGGSPLLMHAETPVAELRRAAERVGHQFCIADAVSERDAAEAGFGSEAFALASWAEGAWLRLESSAGPAVDAPAGVVLHPTSGTTGLPKLAVRPARPALAEAAHYAETFGLGDADVVLGSIPMSHAYGFGSSVMTPMMCGGTVATMRRFNPATALRAIDELGVTLYPASPAAIELLVTEAGGRTTPSATVVLSAGSPLPQRTAIRARERLGVSVRRSYGSTETGVITAARSEDDFGDANSVGRIVPGVSVEVRSEDSAIATGDPVGRIWVSSPSLMAGYLGARGLDPSDVREGWFDTGDLGSIDAAGYVRLAGRVSELINVHGLKVVPSEVEQVIALLPQVSQVKVYSEEGPSGSDRLKAAIVPREDLDERTVRAHCRKHLAPFKRPEAIAFLERFPTTPSGKVRADLLP